MIRYHWALLVGPKVEEDKGKGMRFHAIERVQDDMGVAWLFEEGPSALAPTRMILIRVMVGKVEDRERLFNVLRGTPIRASEPGWNCVSWVKEALEGLKKDGTALGSCAIEWDLVRDRAMGYCQKKRDEHRFDGSTTADTSKIPTYDLIKGKETTA